MGTRCNPGGVALVIHITQGSSFLATLGYGMLRLWRTRKCPNAQRAIGSEFGILKTRAHENTTEDNA